MGVDKGATVVVHEHGSQVGESRWGLNARQMTFMLQHHNVIEAAYTSGDAEALRNLAASQAYKTLFTEMGWDEAFDR